MTSDQPLKIALTNVLRIEIGTASKEKYIDVRQTSIDMANQTTGLTVHSGVVQKTNLNRSITSFIKLDKITPATYHE
jgi:hypothetical protein